MNENHTEELNRERSEVLAQLENWLEWPMIFLGFAWLALLVVELTWGLSPVMDICARAIWAVFVLEFVLKLTLAPGKLDFLRSHWVTAIALLIPAFRVFRIVRVMRAMRITRIARSLRLVRLVTSLNRGMKALGLSMARRGLGYVIALTTIVLLRARPGCTRSNERLREDLTVMERLYGGRPCCSRQWVPRTGLKPPKGECSVCCCRSMASQCSAT